MALYLVWLILLIAIIGLAATIVWQNWHLKQNRDRNTNETTAKHPFMANPIIIAYVLFPIIIIIGAAIVMLNFS